MSISILQIFKFIVAMFIFIMMPSPDVFSIIAKAMTQGAWSALPLAILQLVCCMAQLENTAFREH